MDVGTGLALLGGAKLTEKLLGPTAELIGNDIRAWAEKRRNNVKNIFSIAERKLGDKIETEGAVPPRVLKGILNEGSFCDDELMAEYFGGVLASSRSGISRDDRGAYFIALINRLSSYQIRTHCIFYHIIKRLFDGTSIRINTPAARRKMKTFVPCDVYMIAMDFDKQEQQNRKVLFGHIFYGLQKENLIEREFVNGSKKTIAKYVDFPPKAGILFAPSALGIELFLWAYGKPDLTKNGFFKTTNQFEIDSSINIAPGYMKTKE